MRFDLRTQRTSRKVAQAQNAVDEMSVKCRQDWPSAATVEKLWRRRPRIFPCSPEDRVLISAANLSRNRIEQQGEFGIFSKESLSRTAPASLKALSVLSPEDCFGAQHVAPCRSISPGAFHRVIDQRKWSSPTTEPLVLPSMYMYTVQ